MTVQLAAVNKLLLSVGKIIEAENTVVFRKHDGFIECNRTGENIMFQKRNSTYILVLWVRNLAYTGRPTPRPGETGNSPGAMGFPWQG